MGVGVLRGKTGREEMRSNKSFCVLARGGSEERSVKKLPSFETKARIKPGVKGGARGGKKRRVRLVGGALTKGSLLPGEIEKIGIAKTKRKIACS